MLYFLVVFCRYLHERFVQLQEEVSLLKTNLMKYKVSGELSNETYSTSLHFTFSLLQNVTFLYKLLILR